MKKSFYISFLFVISCLGFGVNAQTLNESQGTGAGISITTGDNNTIYGDSAGATLTSGSGNVFLGTAAGFNATTGGTSTNNYTVSTSTFPSGGNVFIGQAAGYNTTTARDNVFIGPYSGWSNTTGNDNVFMGTGAGRDNTSGYDNVFIGNAAGVLNTTGRDITIVGSDAGKSNTTGNDNTFIGSSAGYTNTTGRQNTFVGNDAGWDNTTGYWNTFIGDSAGIDGSIGIANTFIGHAAGPATEYGSHNTFVGSNAGWDNNRTNNTTQANYNTYVGSETGRTNREGSYNTGIGFDADFTNTGSGSSYNNYTVFMGYQARVYDNYAISIGASSRTYGLGSIGIGGNLDYGVNNIDESIGIGYNGYGRNNIYSTAVGASHYMNNADRSVALGNYDSIVADFGMTIGYDAYSSGKYASAYGYNSKVESDSSMVFGYNSNISSGVVNSIAMGTNATATSGNAFVFGEAANPYRLGVGTTAPNANASIDLAETTKGFLVNRMTTALRTTLGGGLTTSEQGLMVYDTDENILYTWDGTQWNSSLNTDNQDLTLTGNDLTITNGATTIDLSGYLDNTDAQNLTLVGTNLSIDNGNTVDLSGIDTDTQLTEAQVDAYVANNGYLTSFVEIDGDPTNEIQDISLVGSDLSISSGSTIDLSVIDTDTQLTEAQVDAYVANNGYLTSFVEVDGDPTNEIQDISLVGSDLTISSGSTIDLSVIDTDTQIDSVGIAALGFVAGPHTVDTQIDSTGIAALGYVAGPHTVDTDDQTLSLAGNTLSIADGNSVDLSALVVGSDDQNLTAATLTGTMLQIDIENGTSVSVDLAPLLTDLQNQITLIDDRLTILEGCACDSTAGISPIGNGYVESPILYQNIPNPFNNTSSIKYYIPNWVNSANLVISDSFGKLVSNIALNERGAYGTQYVNADGLAPGTYFYTLYVDQTLFDTKKMVVE